MARANVPLLSFNRGILSPKALARVDIDRTRLSAEVMTNWLPKTQGAMRIRPGTKYLGSSINDTGAEYLEFVAATDDTALIELTHQKMRIWIDDTLLGRPNITTTVTLSDTGWSNTSTGGVLTVGSSTDVLPAMTSATTGGVTVSASSENINPSLPGATTAAWNAADDNTETEWHDTGPDGNTMPSWWKVDFGASNTKAVTSYSIRAADSSDRLDNAPSLWSFERSDDNVAWVTEDTQGSETGWAVGERRTYTLPGADTGTVEVRRYWRLNFTALNGDTELQIAEVEMFTAATSAQISLQSGQRVFNALSIGALARAEKRVVVSAANANKEHSLAINVSRGPISLRVGSTARDDDYVSETSLGTGYHNLAFTPTGDFYITLQSSDTVSRTVQSLTIGDTGTVEITTHIDAADLDNIRYDQSADVVYLDVKDNEPHKIERRGTGRSWSFVEYAPDNGPFQSAASSSAKLSTTAKYGNAQLLSDIPFFTSSHVSSASGALFRLFHEGQSGTWPLGANDAKTDAVKVTGINDTGTAGTNSERRVVISATGTWAGTITIERSFDGENFGFHPASPDFMGGSAATDTGTFTRTIDDEDDNLTAWYRARITAHTSGVAVVAITYRGGGVNGIARATSFNNNRSVNVEILSRFSDTAGTDSWQEGSWSDNISYPSAVALHGGRLAHAGGANLYMSVSDDYENFDDETTGDAAPIVRTLGSGPVDSAYYLISLLRLIIGTSGAEIAVRSSSLDEPLTPDNSSARPFSTQGSANLRAVKMDTKAVFVQRSTQRVFMIGLGQDVIGDYDTTELTMLVPDLLAAGVVSIAVQRQPDTRIHCVLANGKVAILTYEPQEEVICWSMWETDGTVERAAVLPGTNEDQVYYHVNRTIGGVTKRFLEKWAKETDSIGDTGLSWLSDCAVSFTHATRSATITGLGHLNGKSAVVWGDDTGQTYPSKDYSPDVAGVQTTHAVAAGSTTLTSGTVHHAVVGLPYTADWKSTKLAYAAESGTALAQMKRTDKIGLVLYQTQNNALYFGNDTGILDPLPRIFHEGAEVDPRKIYETMDAVAMPFPGLWHSDSRICLRAKAPRPVTVLAAVPTVGTNEKV